MTRLTPAPDAQPATWFVAGLRGFAVSVLSLVPDGFASYVRVFHRARTRDGALVTWADIAAANGKEWHAGMQLVSLTGREQHTPHPGVFDEPPRIGHLEPGLAGTLAATLGRMTTTPDRCWFGVWYGSGGLRDDVRAAPTFTTLHREYHLLTGNVDAATESVEDWPAQQSPSIWWPEDHAWCVATEIDLNSTYVGCSNVCHDELLASGLEALPVEPSTGVTYDSDLRNPAPPPLG